LKELKKLQDIENGTTNNNSDSEEEDSEQDDDDDENPKSTHSKTKVTPIVQHPTLSKEEEAAIAELLKTLFDHHCESIFGSELLSVINICQMMADVHTMTHPNDPKSMEDFDNFSLLEDGSFGLLSHFEFVEWMQEGLALNDQDLKDLSPKIVAFITNIRTLVNTYEENKNETLQQMSTEIKEKFLSKLHDLYEKYSTTESESWVMNENRSYIKTKGDVYVTVQNVEQMVKDVCTETNLMNALWLQSNVVHVALEDIVFRGMQQLNEMKFVQLMTKHLIRSNFENPIISNFSKALLILIDPSQETGKYFKRMESVHRVYGKHL